MIPLMRKFSFHDCFMIKTLEKVQAFWTSLHHQSPFKP